MGAAFRLFLLAIPTAMIVACALAIRRSLRWTRVDAVVCPDAEHLRLTLAQRPRRARIVMFEGPAGPCVARLSDLDEDAGFPVGSTIRIVVNPADPAEVAFRHSVAWHSVGLVLAGAAAAFLLTLPWRIAPPG